MNNQKIPLKDLDKPALEVMNEAAHAYAMRLRDLVNDRRTAQAHIHYSILSSYGHEVFKKVANPYPPAKGSMKLEVFTAFVALDTLQYYLNETRIAQHQAICRRLIDQLDPLLPTTSDLERFTVNSDLEDEN